MNFYTTEEIANMLKLDIVTIRRYITQGDIKAVKFGKAWRISEEDFKKFIKSKEIVNKKDGE